MNRYKALKVKGKKIDEHRYIIEKYLGRELSEDEVVHHINGNKKDNRIENLQVMTRKEHSSIHSKGYVMPDSQKNKIRNALIGKPNYSCRSLTEKDVAEIYELSDKGHSKREIAFWFNISHSSVVRITKGQSYKELYSKYYSK